MKLVLTVIPYEVWSYHRDCDYLLESSYRAQAESDRKRVAEWCGVDVDDVALRYPIVYSEN